MRNTFRIKMPLITDTSAEIQRSMAIMQFIDDYSASRARYIDWKVRCETERKRDLQPVAAINLTPAKPL